MSIDAKGSGFWIPRAVYLDKRLTMTEKFLFVEIVSLSSLKLGCVAGNAHFAQLLAIDETSVSRSLNNMQRKGYIEIAIAKGSRNMSRTIRVLNIDILDGEVPENSLLTNRQDELTDCHSPLTKCQESKDNNSSTNSFKEKYIQKEPEIPSFETPQIEVSGTERAQLLRAFATMVFNRYQFNILKSEKNRRNAQGGIGELIASGVSEARIAAVIEWLSGNEYDFPIDTGGKLASCFISIEGKMKQKPREYEKTSKEKLAEVEESLNRQQKYSNVTPMDPASPEWVKHFVETRGRLFDEPERCLIWERVFRKKWPCPELVDWDKKEQGQ